MMNVIPVMNDMANSLRGSAARNEWEQRQFAKMGRHRRYEQRISLL